MLDMAHHAHYLAFESYQFQIHMLAKRVLPRKRLAREVFINIHRARRFLIVLRCDQSSAQQWNTHYVEVIRIHTVEQGHIHLALLWLGTALYPVRQLGVSIHWHAPEHNADRSHA